MTQDADKNFKSNEEKKNTKKSYDLFYSRSNMDHLRRGIKALNTGKGTEHELIEDEQES